MRRTLGNQRLSTKVNDESQLAYKANRSPEDALLTLIDMVSEHLDIDAKTTLELYPLTLQVLSIQSTPKYLSKDLVIMVSIPVLSTGHTTEYIEKHVQDYQQIDR